MGHYNSWKYIVDNNLDNCVILEDGIEFLRNDFENIKINDELDILFINEEMKVQTNDNKNNLLVMVYKDILFLKRVLNYY